MTKKEKKAERIRKHNEQYLYEKVNPKSDRVIIKQALLDVVKSIK